MEKVIVKRMPFTSCQVIESDNLRDNFHLNDINGCLKICILSGLIKVEGLADSLIKKTHTHGKSEVHSRLCIVTERKSMTMIQKQQIKINYSTEATNDNRATHVVTQIAYGANAKFTFSKQMDEKDDEKIIKDRLLTCAKSFTRVAGAMASIDENCAEKRKEMYDDIEVELEGDFQNRPDFHLDIPKTYKEAIDFVPKFYSCVCNSTTLGVPKRVWLLPLGEYLLNNLLDYCFFIIAY